MVMEFVNLIVGTQVLRHGQRVITIRRVNL